MVSLGKSILERNAAQFEDVAIGVAMDQSQKQVDCRRRILL